MITDFSFFGELSLKKAAQEEKKKEISKRSRTGQESLVGQRSDLEN